MAIAPVNYIINLRVQNALSQLKYSDENISKIARRCGWRDPNYFSRCIRKASGQSPEDFRES
jgi:AraC-like DNA-binding protein